MFENDGKTLEKRMPTLEKSFKQQYMKDDGKKKPNLLQGTGFGEGDKKKDEKVKPVSGLWQVIKSNLYARKGIKTHG